MLGLQLVALFWEMGAYLEEIGHWMCDCKDYTWSLVPSSLKEAEAVMS
jgi:hypothetical protein